ncbi:transcription factor 24-like [Lethenteron reissneri]|uniref:transcription factor 24-like n=1 Tax=Lethenteron reissneri TaxID=7753 RepID=UPI002AB6DC48|nr:transcription factor 24-like [Lethenteron reissneri]
MNHTAPVCIAHATMSSPDSDNDDTQQGSGGSNGDGGGNAGGSGLGGGGGHLDVAGPGSARGGRAGRAGRPAVANAARERSRVRTLRHAFLALQRALPAVPPDTKLSKLDVLLLATTYIAHLTRALDQPQGPSSQGQGQGQGHGQAGQGAGTAPAGAVPPGAAAAAAARAGSAQTGSRAQSLKTEGYLHPVKKWPLRSRLYMGATGNFLLSSSPAGGEPTSGGRQAGPGPSRHTPAS